MASARTFPIRYGLFRPLLSVLGMGPAFSRVDIEGGVLRVRMGWWFSADVPLASVTGARRHRGFVGGIGVHGWRGWWLVNGSARGIVSIDIDPPARARVMGVPARLRKLDVSVKSPDELVAALQR
ncbi:MAG: hypothetical protein M3203_12185 [Actinomycetota bacterium]|nr:hypothetical protein [Actinomycetota bacterium]